jgi:protein AaeX
MPRELSFGGVLLPGLLAVFLACLLLMVLVDLVAGRLGLYRHVWHPSLFRFALFVCLFGAAGLWLLH